MNAYLINLAAATLAIVVLCYVEPAIAKMGSGTSWLVRYLKLFCAGVAAAVFMHIFSGGNCDWLTIIILAIILLLLMAERWWRSEYPCNQGGRHA